MIFVDFVLYLDEVVPDDDVLDLEGLAAGHELGAEELDAVEVEAADGRRGEGAVHQRVGVHPLVAEVPDVLQDLVQHLDRVGLEWR